MAEVTDAVGIQFRLLNTSRGPAVWSPRAQCDKKQYRIRMKEVLEREPNLHIKQAEVASLIIEDGRVRGVHLIDGRSIRCEAWWIITTGTFLNGLAHIGETARVTWRSQRRGPVTGAGGAGPQLGTGMDSPENKRTPPRLDARSIDWSKFEPQFGDTNPSSASPFSRKRSTVRRSRCYLARTTAGNEAAHPRQHQ